MHFKTPAHHFTLTPLCKKFNRIKCLVASCRWQMDLWHENEPLNQPCKRLLNSRAARKIHTQNFFDWIWNRAPVIFNWNSLSLSHKPLLMLSACRMSLWVHFFQTLSKVSGISLEFPFNFKSHSAYCFNCTSHCFRANKDECFLIAFSFLMSTFSK